MDTATKAKLDALKTAIKIVAHKAAGARGELTGNKITNENYKTKTCTSWGFKKCWTNNYSTRAKIKYKMSILLNNSVVSKFVTKNRSK